MATRSTIQGQLQFEELKGAPHGARLKVLAVDRHGQALGSAEVSEKGEFELSVPLAEPGDVKLLVGPAVPDEELRKTAGFSREFRAADWRAAERGALLRADLTLDKSVWKLFLPAEVCVSGHVRKVVRENGSVSYCPVPFAKVEVFDVDRESCWWPLLRPRLPELEYRKVLRVPDLLATRPLRPIPEPPDPARTLLGRPPRPVPLHHFQPFRPATRRDFGGPALSHAGHQHGGASQAAETPGATTVLEEALPARAAAELVGEVKTLSADAAAKISDLTLTSKLAPWVIFPGCFYSRALVCTTTTDEDGYFNCCFSWWPFHFRRGRLRFDSRPDVILRVTQVVDGVERVIYLDPYTSTRWNVTNTHIHLFLDDDEVVCGNGDPQDRPEGSQVFFTRIGTADEVYKINQANGLYEHMGITNAAYGSTLALHAQFGTALSSGAPTRYYRLSYAKAGTSSFTPIAGPLSDTRVHRITNFSESHTLGPVTVGSQAGLYEIRDFTHYLWYHPDLIGYWNTLLAEEDTGKYVLRLEVFDEAGNKLTSAQVDYRDGTAAPPAVLPPMTDACDLVITLDNKAPVATLTVSNVVDPVCGLIEWTPTLHNELTFTIDVMQENGRLHQWGFSYQQGISGASGSYGDPPSNNGAPATVHRVLSNSNLPSFFTLVQNMTRTCAFTLHLGAYAHVRNGNDFLVHTLRDDDEASIAIEKCA